MKTIERLINTDKKEMQIGNHSKFSIYRGNKVPVNRFKYHSTVICEQSGDIFYTDNGGWHTISTTQAINAYKRIFAGLKEVSKEEFYQIINS